MAVGDRTWIPVSRWVTSWPAGAVEAPALDDVGIVDFENSATDGALAASCTLAFATDLAFAVPGVDGLELLLLADGGEARVTVEAVLSSQLTVSLLELSAGLRLASDLLRPVARSSPAAPWEPVLAGDGSPAPLEAAFGADRVTVDGEGRLVIEPAPAIGLDPFTIGDTGIVVEATDVALHLSDAGEPPPGCAAGFRGISIEHAAVHLPDAFALDLAPDSIVATGLVIGTGGVSGALTGTWTPAWSGTEPSGDGSGTLAGLPFALESLTIELAGSSVAGAALSGRLAVPFFDALLDVDVTIAADGALALAVRAADGVLADLSVPGLGSLAVAALGLVSDDEGEGLLISGDLQPELGAPALTWPLVTLQDLRIGGDGTIEVPGGWITLQNPLALNLYGFGMEITRIGFGSEEDGRRWFGVDGSVRLTELLPAGASARGLRAIWDPQRPTALPSIALDGIGVFFGIPDAFGFEGEVALIDDPNSDARLFTGALSLGLDALDVGIDAGITIGRDSAATYVFVHLGVNVPIPLAATGTALYGLEGLFAMNMSPLVTNAPVEIDATTTVDRGDWYGWYRDVPEPFSVTDPFKWSPDIGAWAFGAGLSLGTLPDAGFTVNTKALLVVLLPGPVILLQGTADIFKAPAAFGGGNSQEGTFGLLAAIDGRAGTLQLGLDAAWSVPALLDISASTEAFFDFDRLDAWHLWLGRDEPESLRIRAEVLSLFHADSWLMLDAKGVGTGLGVSFGDSWRFGPVKLTLSAWIGATASLSTRPAQLEGALDLGGEAAIAAGPFGLGLSVAAGLEGKSFAPYHVAGTLAVVVGLPFPLKDLDVDIELEWTQPETPAIEDPWAGALVEHERCTESWTPVTGGSTAGLPDAAAPVVPLDAGVLLTFTKPMGDDAPVADNPPAPVPVTAIGDHTATYALTDLRLHRRRRSHPDEGWADVSDTVFGTWTPDADGAGSRLQLLARSPFAFTRATSRRWIDSFLEAQTTWPCTPPPAARRTCIDWDEYKEGMDLPRLWEQGGATLSSEAPLTVQDWGDGHAISLVWGAAPDGTPQPGLLWIALPEPCAEVTMEVVIGGGDWVALRAWSGADQVDVDLGLPSADSLQVEGERIDAVTLGWGFNVEPLLLRVCWQTRADVDALDAWSAAQEGLETAAERWSSEEPILEPDSHYLLEATTCAVLSKGSGEVDRIEQTHAVQFQTGGPPGIVPPWAPEDGGFPHEGVLAALSPYVRRSIPDAAAVPVFRAYDLGCEFDASHVQQMYGADMRIRVRDHDGRPALAPDGSELVLENAWEEAPATTLTTSEASWLTRLDACTGDVEWTSLAADEQLRADVPGLLYDDFSGTLGTAWSAHLLDPAETRAPGWHLDGGTLVQDVEIDGGTVYVSADVDAADVAVETVGWAQSGSFGLVFRWRSSADLYRFSITPDRQRLVRVSGGAVRELWSAPGGYAPGVPTLLAVTAEGARIRCQVGERLVCDVVDAEAGAATAGSVGLYSFNSDSTAFEELRARVWPGAALGPERPYTAALEASRPLFTDTFEDLAAFDGVVLSTGAAAPVGSAAGGVATIKCAKAGDPAVAVLAGDPASEDLAVECSARPTGTGVFGLVARHSASDSYLALQLVPGAGRSLIAHLGGGGRIAPVKVLWQDDGAVRTGATYALGLRCEGSTVTAVIDGEEFAATTTLASGRFGLLSGIAGAGCEFTDLVVRSAPRTTVHSWTFTTSRYLGLPDLLDTFVGTVWPVDAGGLDAAGLAAEATAGAARLAAARAAVDTARAALAAAAVVDLEPLAAAANAAVASAHAESAAVHDLLEAALGLPYRPTPPVAELSAISAGRGVVALLLDLPEPLPWERITWTLLDPGQAAAAVLLAWSADGTRAILVRDGAEAFAAGAWILDLALRLDAGGERAVWRRGGSTAPEAGRLPFTL